MVASLQTQSHHAQAELFDLLVGLLPGKLFPDTKLFLAESHLFIAVKMGTFDKMLGKGLRLVHNDQRD